MIHLMICDDHHLIRDALTRILEADGRLAVLAQVSDRAELLDVLSKQARDIDVLLLDLQLDTGDVMDGIASISVLCQRHPGLRILVVSFNEDPVVVKAAMAAGAFGYVTKGSPFEVLKQAVRHIHLGEHFLDPRVVHTVMKLGSATPKPAWNADLTQREQQVLTLLIQGQRVSDIALTLHLSVKTVSTHKIRLMEKLKVSSNADLIKLGVRHRVA